MANASATNLPVAPMHSRWRTAMLAGKAANGHPLASRKEARHLMTRPHGCWLRCVRAPDVGTRSGGRCTDLRGKLARSLSIHDHPLAQMHVA